MAEDKDGPGFFYPTIYTVHARNNKTYYLAIRSGRYSNTNVSTGIQALTIQNDSINDLVGFFQAKTKLLNNIDCYYDRDEEQNSIKISVDKQKLYIPIVDGEIKKNKFLVYKFDGNKFVFDKNAK